jgi:hypothetical protein
MLTLPGIYWFIATIIGTIGYYKFTTLVIYGRFYLIENTAPVIISG